MSTKIWIDKEKTVIRTFFPMPNEKGAIFGLPAMSFEHSERLRAFDDDSQLWNKTTYNLYGRFETFAGRNVPEIPEKKLLHDDDGNLIDGTRLVNEMFDSYANYVSPILACWITRHIYSLRPTEKNLHNYYDVCAYCNSAGYAKNDYDNYLDINHDELFALPALQKGMQKKISRTEARRRAQNTLQYAKLHTFGMEKGKDGKRHRIAYHIVKTTLHNTEKGKHVFSLDYSFGNDSDAWDIISDVKECILYLVNIGYVKSFHDIAFARSFAMRYICNNLELQASRKKNDVVLDDCANMPHVSNDIACGPADLHGMQKFENIDMLKSFRKFVLHSLPKKANRINTMFVYDNCILSDMSISDAAEYMGVSDRMARKYRKYLFDVLTSENAKRFISGEHVAIA